MFSVKQPLKKLGFKSVSWKLTFWYAAIFLISVLLIAFYLHHRLKTQLYEEVDFFLSDEMAEFTHHVSELWPVQKAIKEQIAQETSTLRKHYQMYYAVLDAEQNPIIQSTKFTPAREEKEIGSSVFDDFQIIQYRIDETTDTYPIRVHTKSLKLAGDTELILQVGLNLKRTIKTLDDYKENFLFVMPFMLFAAIAGGYFMARRNLRPLRQLRDTANRISLTNLKERIPRRGTADELDQLTETFNRMIDRLDEAYKRISQFSTDAAHELRTPLTAVLGELEVVMTRTRNPEDYRTAIQSIFDELTRLSKLVNHLLFISQSEKEEIEQEMKYLNLAEIVEDIAETFRPLAEESKLHMNLKLPDQPIWIRGVKWRIEQMISNLLENAIYYNRPEGEIRIKIDGLNALAVLEVCDSGIGIDEDIQNKIFDRFYRAASSQRHAHKGTGLGLSVVRSVVQSHDGTINVESTVNQGTCFRIEFPLQSIRLTLS